MATWAQQPALLPEAHYPLQQIKEPCRPASTVSSSRHYSMWQINVINESCKQFYSKHTDFWSSESKTKSQLSVQNNYYFMAIIQDNMH